MNKLKKNIIYQYMLVSSILVIASSYAMWSIQLISKYLKNDFISNALWWGGLLIIEIVLFTICAYWYYKKVSVYIEDETRKQIKKQNQLFANIAHDLKSPMTVVIGLSRALEEGVTTREEEQELIHAITAKSKHIDKVINLMFQYAKMESSSYKLNKTSVNIVRLLKELVAQRYNQFEEKKIEIDLKIPDYEILVDIDELEISRAIDNIISNAIIHNGKNTKVQIGLEKKEDFIEIWVADTGIEISKELENKIFEPFVCTEESRNIKGGSGLGLAISKKIIEMHEGRVYIKRDLIEYTKAFMVRI